MPTPFNQLCEELNVSLTPALVARGYVAPGVPFNRKESKYEFKRSSPSGTQTLAVLFNRNRRPNFSIQLYVEPTDGWASARARGEEFIVGFLVRRRRIWPFAVEHFGLHQSKIAAFLGRPPKSAAQAIQEAIALVPEVEGWWLHQANHGHIITATSR